MNSWVLVVDDDTLNLKMASKMLSGAGLRTSGVKSGQAALSFLEKNTPDLILLDIHMPEMDGFETLERLKGNGATADLPVIFLTADDNRDAEVRGFQCGAQDFVKKPFVPEILLQRVRRTIQLSRLQKDLSSEVEKQTRWALEREQKIERMSVQLVQTLSGTIDAKDRYTNGHSNRVAQYSRELARRCGKTEEEQMHIYMLALLHDVGKIGIPDGIIRKTSRLTDEEYAVIKTHPAIGADILKNITEMPDVGIGAHWHHERYDGRGYPDGLKGEEIPEIARMIAVADAYDAMTSSRSYRGILKQDIVRNEIAKGVGTQFDPAFACVMLEMIDEDTDYRMREGGQV